MGRPNILDNLLNTLFDKDTLQSWNIYQEQSGHVTVKLRFKGEGGSQTGLNIGQAGQVSFKRKSTQQTLRDKTRAEKHQNDKQGVVTRSKSKKQSVESQDIEQPRTGDNNNLSFSSGMSQAIGHSNMLMSDTPPVCIGEDDVTQDSPGLRIQDNSILENSPTTHTSYIQNKNIQSTDDQQHDDLQCMTAPEIKDNVDECSSLSSDSESDSVPSTSHINCSSVDDLKLQICNELTECLRTQVHDMEKSLYDLHCEFDTVNCTKSESNET